MFDTFFKLQVAMDGVLDNFPNRFVAAWLRLLVFPKGLTLDSARLVLARTITNARGEFELPRAPQARTLRTLRLGFRPVRTQSMK